MSDDIDIEEHDLMDNPAIKKIFPDLMVLKKEIQNFYEEDLEMHIEPKSSSACGLEPVEIFNDYGKSAALPLEEHCDLTFTSEVSFTDKDNPVLQKMANDNTTPKLNSNKIILGSKPNKQINQLASYEEFFEKQVKPHQPKVLLDDLGPYLGRSNRYCEICLTLFPNKDVFNTHNKTVHTHKDIVHTHAIVKNKIFKEKGNVAIYSSKKVKCNLCKSVFSSRSSLNRHLKHAHNGSFRKNNSKNKNINAIMTRVQSKILMSGSHKSCFHCKKSFPNQESLIEHLYNTLQSDKITRKMFSDKFCNNEKSRCDKYNQKVKDSSTETVHKTKSQCVTFNINTKDLAKIYYRCCVCSYYYKDAKVYMQHLANNHKMLRFPKMELISFESKCKYCSQEFDNMSMYNRHLKQFHKKYCYIQKVSVNELLEMNLEPDRALNNDEESLTDKDSYVPLVLKLILFKCNKCDIHFLSAKAAMNHSEHMELLINWKCSICQQIFKKRDEVFHQMQHLFTHKFDVIKLSGTALSRVLYSCPKCTVNFDEDNLIKHYPTCGIKTFKSVYCSLCDILIDETVIQSHKESHDQDKLKSDYFTIVKSDIISHTDKRRNFIKTHNTSKRKSVENVTDVNRRRRKYNENTMFDVFYCKTCKCYLTDSYKRILHLQSRCGHLIKYVCKSCGLVLTAKSYQRHKSLHRKYKNLKLQDFNFYDIKNNRICAPLPEYPKCDNCEVYFASKNASKRHECSDEDYLTCHICNIKLSEETFKLHMSFHKYLIVNENDVLSQDIVLNNDIMKSNTNILNQTDATESKRNLKLKSNLSTVISTDDISEQLKEDTVTMHFIYNCTNCDVTVDTYDKVIEHCQDHYSPDKKETVFEMCPFCNLKFDIACYENHYKMHLSNSADNFFKILKFDTFYFTSENSIWIKHLFGSLPQEQIDKITSTSIYKSEARIKMEVIQDGRIDLTVYKCEQCRCFVSDSTIYRHAENSCFKLRKHPCSFCGLPFLSSVSKLDHEKLHRGTNVGLKSYRVVIFNREADKRFNTCYSRKQYVLYQCRNCNGLVDKSQINSHKCNINEIKKCVVCGLLIYNKDYDLHILRHKELVNFTQNNMKVILFGEKSENQNLNLDALVPSFSGNVCDYIFYRCIKCEVCVKTLPCTLKHNCVFGSSKLKCRICNLYFIASKMKNHKRLHENDPDFVRDNMKLITFVPLNSMSETKDDMLSITRANTSNDLLLPEFDKNKGQENDNDTVACESTAKIYKCSCGLNFLDEVSINTHHKNCNPKIRVAKQKCSKCNFLFTPNILFKHLLIHHGNKKLIYKFEIVDIATNKKSNALNSTLTGEIEDENDRQLQNGGGPMATNATSQTGGSGFELGWFQ